MSSFYQYLSVLGSFQGCLLFILLISDRRISGAGKVLGVCCLLFGLSFLLPFITLGLAPKAFYPLAGWLFFLPAAYSATLYLYCKNVIADRSLTLSDALHLTPVLFCYALTIDTLLFDSEAFRLWIVGAEAPTWRVWASEYLLVAIAIFYGLAAVYTLLRYRSAASNNLSNYNAATFTWLLALVLLFLLILAIKTSWAFAQSASWNMIVLSDLLLVVFVYLIALAHWRKPQLFMIQGLAASEAVAASSTDLKATTGSLDADTRAAMYELVDQKMTEQTLYRRPDLTLAELAQASAVNVHHLSEVLNKHGGSNFNQFVNAYRVAEVKERLMNTDSPGILKIAFEAGFSSKSSFNTIFKREVGVTPSQYRKQCLATGARKGSNL